MTEATGYSFPRRAGRAGDDGPRPPQRTAVIWGSVWLAAITAIAVAIDGYAAFVLAPAVAVVWLPATITVAVRSGRRVRPSRL